MKRPILWTIACVLVIVAAVVGGQTATTLGWITIALAVLCAGLQWLVYLKNNRQGK
jgi:hypothetical protein